MMKTIFLFCLVLFATVAFGQFGEQQIITSCTYCQPTDIKAADLDSDGATDLIACFELDNKIVWFKNLGNGNFSKQQLISTQVDGIKSIHAVDLDGDSRIDILLASFQDNKVAWYRNEGDGNFSEQLIISDETIGATLVQTADINNDGILDVLAAASGSTANTQKLVWYQNEGNGIFSSSFVIATFEGTPRSIYAADFDGDNDTDVLSNASSYYGSLALYVNEENGQFTEKIISNSNYVFTVNAADFDGDNDLDIVYLDQSGIVTVQKNNGIGQFSEPFYIPTRFNGVYSPLQAADINNDGARDIIYTTNDGNAVAWSSNDGTGRFSDPQIIYAEAEGTVALSIAHIDGNDKIDIISASNGGNKIVAHLNNSNGNFTNQIIVLSKTKAPYTISTADLDKDGDMDIIAASLFENKITWYRQDDALYFSDEILISSAISEVSSIATFDLDGDEDIDILASGRNEVAWFKNNGFGNFAAPSILFSESNEGGSVTATDFDKDGDLDIISTGAHQISWFKNEGNGSFSAPIVLAEPIRSAIYAVLYAADIDKDGYQDIVTTSKNGGSILWYKNDGNGNIFDNPFFVGSINGSGIENGANAAFIIDVDNDGDLDVLSPSNLRPSHNTPPLGQVIWFENDGAGIFNYKYIVFEKEGVIKSLNVEDLDGDGDTDLLVSFSKGIAWSENNGKGKFSSPIRIPNLQDGAITPYTFISATSIFSADIDNDLDLDVLAVDYYKDKITWYENLSDYPAIVGTVFWDENANKQFEDNELPITNLPITLTPTSLASYTGLDGKFRFYIDDGQYELSVHPDSCWQLTTDSLTYQVIINGNTSLNRDFGFKLIAEAQKTQTQIIAAPTRCGFEVPFWVSVQSDTCGVNKGLYGVVLDSLVTYLNAEVEPSFIKGDTILWECQQLAPPNIQQIQVNLQIAGTDYLGDTIRLTGLSYIEDAQGQLQLSSTYDFTSEIRCAYDPNDKLVLPNRNNIYNQNYTLFAEALEYTIRFQNTGNDTAFTVIIRDTLDVNLDWSTFKPITASHNFETLLYPNGLVEFTFKNILLPDSTTNEPLSHGFITFGIAPMKGLPENTEINNTADIYFDFNPPIRTNTTNNVFVSALPKITSTKTLNHNFNLTVFPNPFRNAIHFQIKDNALLNDYTIHLFDAQGRRLAVQKMTEGRCTIQNNNFPAGLYFYTLSDVQGNIFTSGKLVRK